MIAIMSIVFHYHYESIIISMEIVSCYLFM
jgi:hypothetical protein